MAELSEEQKRIRERIEKLRSSGDSWNVRCAECPNEPKEFPGASFGIPIPISGQAVTLLAIGIVNHTNASTSGSMNDFRVATA